uniref:Homing endonuclease LAGLIDADG domain-containing protein n=1 Tax=Orbilia brochopaga TaxID=3140254 RepID=A0A4Y5MV47_9PEZI|nr:hypothetical protein [Drechslerella brochopaga]
MLMGEGCFNILVIKSRSNLIGWQQKIFCRHYSTKINLYKPLDPGFVTGFTDGCFWISISKDTKFKTGWRVRPYFEIHLHSKDLVLLREIQSFFNVGKIYDKNWFNSISSFLTKRTTSN